MKTLKDLFQDELMDMYDAEHRITRALPKMVKTATCEKLKDAFETHLKETEQQIKNLEKVFKLIGEKAKSKKCEATVGLLKEGDEIGAEFKGSPAVNAALIAAGQKVEHYEIASYGCLCEWAKLLGHNDAARLLEQNLEQEKNANDTLTEIARSGDNEEALEGSPAAPERKASPRSRLSGARSAAATKAPRSARIHKQQTK